MNQVQAPVSNKNLIINPKTKDILSYESHVWTSADVLRSSVGLKNSEFPDFMMPFFALVLIESRLVRKYVEVLEDKSLTTEKDRIDEIKETAGFYNSVIVEEKILLSDLVKNDKTFDVEFIRYLNAFDLDLKNLLGIIKGDKTENLNLIGCVDSLKKKRALFGYVAAWANVDFTPYNNSEITTLEEHIKRKWADMSAETAGEQYTPDDVINLISELIVTDKFDENKIYKIYDMTCGGGNMLFGVEDRILSLNNKFKTSTYGQELRGSLYALAKIESKFRPSSHIENGNTLTNDKFVGDEFDYGVANPPYGVSWKEEQKAIESDQTGRFKPGKPSVSDGQLLFVEHMISKLNKTGKAFVVLNGSPLFSGDAGGGESNIRKWVLDNDYLESLIQLPTNEFFNTGITTYIWCLNKDKPSNRKDKILCINAENKAVKLKKNKGMKSQEISPTTAKEIALIYANFQENDFSKIKSKYDFYYNKQSLMRLDKDDEFGAFENGINSIDINKFNTVYISNRDPKMIGGIRITNPIQNKNKEEADKLNKIFKDFDNEEQNIVVFVDNRLSYSLNENHCIIESKENENKNLGYGEIELKAVYKKATNKNSEDVIIEISIKPSWYKDEEKINFNPNKEVNDKNIKDFLYKWVSENSSDYKLLTNVVGVEINFNSIFPKKIEIRSTADILTDIAALDNELKEVI